MNGASSGGWLRRILCVAPAALSLGSVAVLHHLDALGKVHRDPGFGVEPIAAEWVILICVLGSVVPAFLNTRGESWAVTIVTWGGLVMLNLLVAVPGCSMILG
jgi:hypothetical protein